MTSASPSGARRGWLALLAFLALALLTTSVAGLVVLRWSSDGDAELGWSSDGDAEAPVAPGDDRPSAPAAPRDPSPRPAEVPADAEAAVLARIVDGDTIRVVAAPGGDPTDSIRVRLLNIDAPELGRDGGPPECLAVAASERLAALLAPGEVIWLAGDTEDRDRFERPLRGVWTSQGVFVNELLAAEGLARSLLIPPNDRFHTTIVAAEQRAQAAGRGVWGAACNAP